ncbi:protein of unknown function [Nitratireductor aquimarinus]
MIQVVFCSVSRRSNPVIEKISAHITTSPGKRENARPG